MQWGQAAGVGNTITDAGRRRAEMAAQREAAGLVLACSACPFGLPDGDMAAGSRQQPHSDLSQVFWTFHVLAVGREGAANWRQCASIEMLIRLEGGGGGCAAHAGACSRALQLLPPTAGLGAVCCREKPADTQRRGVFRRLRQARPDAFSPKGGPAAKLATVDALLDPAAGIHWGWAKPSHGQGVGSSGALADYTWRPLVAG